MARDIRGWLEAIGLGGCADAFAENAVDFSILPHLTNDDLRELGIQRLGDRRRLLLAIRDLDGGAAAGEPQASHPLRARAHPVERRLLTVMFCDLVGYTRLSHELDPEALRAVMKIYQDVLAGAVTRYGGHVAKYLGDGVLAYFGWPRAYEDQAVRAVRAAEEALARLSEARASSEADLEARVGIATGLVVVGDLENSAGRDPEAVSGATPNLAARLQQMAEPGRIVLDSSTRRLLGGAFFAEELGSQSLKGFDEDVEAWAVIAENEEASRFEAMRGRRLTPLAGRRRELEELLRCWRLAEGGEGRAVLISGDAGIGKSRLLNAVKEELGSAAPVRLTYQCSPHHANSPFHPVIRQLEHAAGFLPDDDEATRRGKLADLLGDAAVETPRHLSLLSSLLSLPGGGHVDGLTPQQRREQTVKALLSQLSTTARERPVLFVLEDAHWIDPSTQHLLEQTVPHIRTQRVLMLVTSRPGWSTCISGEANASDLVLRRLRRQASRSIARATAQDLGARLDNEVMETIVDRGDGVPLYIEEIAKSAAEARGGGFGVPDSLQASLMGRLDRLGPGKSVAQIGSAVGRVFHRRLVEDVSALSRRDVEAGIRALLESELINAVDPPPTSRYRFKHALVQDAAYESMLLSDRKELHGRIAARLQAPVSPAEAVEPEVLAHHHAEAGDRLAAARDWCAAGRKAHGKAAYREAIAHAGRAIAALEPHPRSEERDGVELDCRLVQATAHLALEGYAADGTVDAYRSCAEIAGRLPYDGRQAAVLYGLFVSTWNKGELFRAIEHAETLLDAATRNHDDEAGCVGHRSLAVAFNAMGRHEEALERASEAVSLHDAARHRESAYRFGQDIGVAALWHKAIPLQHLGRPDEALAAARQAEELSESLGHATTQAYCMIWSGLFHGLRREADRTVAVGERMVPFAQERQMMFFTAWGHWHIGVGLTIAGGDPTRALDHMRRGGELFAAGGIGMFEPLYAGPRAEAMLQLGDADGALKTIDHALKTASRTGEGWTLPEIHRVRAKAIRAAGRGDGERELAKAIGIARRQKSRHLELRAACDLAEARMKGGDAAEARRMLAAAGERIHGGGETWDVARARSLFELRLA